MALRRPDTGQFFVQDVQVNGLPMHYFERHRNSLAAGDSLLLARDKGNLHDARAVKVCTLKNIQLGWVPKVCNHDIAQLMDDGAPLWVTILSVGPAELKIRVQDHAFAPRPMSFSHKVDLQGNAGQEGVAPFINGTRFPFRTDYTRTSISVVDPADARKDLGWFLKKDLPEGALGGLHAGALHLVRRPGGLYIEDEATAQRLDDEARVYGVSLSPTGRTYSPAPEIQNFPTTTTEKGNTMSLSSKTTSLINNNKSAATQAGYLEAGRIANNQVVKLSSKALPMMVRVYADTPIGKLVIANVAQMAAAQLRPNDQTLTRLTNAMTVAAYQEVIQTVDIEGWLDELMSSPAIKRAVDKMGTADAAAD